MIRSKHICFNLSKLKAFPKSNFISKHSSFCSKDYKEPEDMSAFYRAVKNKIDKVKAEEDPNPIQLRKIWNFKNTIAWSLSSVILYFNGI